MTDAPRRAVSTTGAPAAIGPYSQAIRAGSLLFISGQIPLEPVSGTIVAGDVEAQAHQALQNLGAILAAAGVAFDAVVKTTVYLLDLADFEVVNRVYAGYFPSPAPARATVEVARLPRDARVEIDAIAVLPG